MNSRSPNKWVSSNEIISIHFFQFTTWNLIANDLKFSLNLISLRKNSSQNRIFSFFMQNFSTVNNSTLPHQISLTLNFSTHKKIFAKALLFWRLLFVSTFYAHFAFVNLKLFILGITGLPGNAIRRKFYYCIEFFCCVWCYNNIMCAYTFIWGNCAKNATKYSMVLHRQTGWLDLIIY